MPPKNRRTKTVDSSKETSHAECQTDLYDEEFERDMHGIRNMKNLANESQRRISQDDSQFNNGSVSTTPTVANSGDGKSENVLVFQLKASARIITKLSAHLQRTQAENERVMSFFHEIMRLVRTMRSEYDSTFLTTRDSLDAMSSDMGRYLSEVHEYFNRQKLTMEEERKRHKQHVKAKDIQISHLQEKLKMSTDELKIALEAFEAQERRATAAERDTHACREEVREVNSKLNDQLFLAGNQKCMSCQVNEKLREMLSNEVAEKTNTANMFQRKCYEVEGQLAEQRHINELLSRSVDKHLFVEKAIRAEFERIKGEYNSLLAETRESRAKLDATNTIVPPATSTPTDVSAQVSSTLVITPPDSSASDNAIKDDCPPIKATSTASDLCERRGVQSHTPPSSAATTPAATSSNTPSTSAATTATPDSCEDQSRATSTTSSIAAVTSTPTRSTTTSSITMSAIDDTSRTPTKTTGGAVSTTSASTTTTTTSLTTKISETKQNHCEAAKRAMRRAKIQKSSSIATSKRPILIGKRDGANSRKRLQNIAPLKDIRGRMPQRDVGCGSNGGIRASVQKTRRPGEAFFHARSLASVAAATTAQGAPLFCGPATGLNFLASRIVQQQERCRLMQDEILRERQMQIREAQQMELLQEIRARQEREQCNGPYYGGRPYRPGMHVSPQRSDPFNGPRQLPPRPPEPLVSARLRFGAGGRPLPWHGNSSSSSSTSPWGVPPFGRR